MTSRTPLDWDYGDVARAYLKRPGYAPAAIDEIVATAGLAPGACVADIGAGTGNLTVPLLERGLRVTAIEPNDAMRALGRERTRSFPALAWRSSVAEHTGLADASHDAVGFGSSFNVVDAAAAVAESARIVRPDGWLFCLWNHRELDDALQAAIEAAIRHHVPKFEPGTRRADPSARLRGGGWFGDVRAIEATVRHRIAAVDFVEAWQAHLTLRRAAGTAFPAVLDAIAALVAGRGASTIEVPYVTRAWLARKRGR
ncbi:methyltransferase domain-containing protein [Candidatus Binatia bacterium]|jgi:SAM-dependent methyltransferase|nr:methyltransferase domain-containing protein [Candidatus Binatia bacterium]